MSFISYFLIGAVLGSLCNIGWHQYKLHILRKERNELLKSINEEFERQKELIKKFKDNEKILSKSWIK